MPSPACPYCQRTMIKRHPSLQPTRDHVVPRSQGGRATVICCLDCNGIKADLLPLAWSAFMLANPEWWRLPRNEIRRRKRLLVVADDTPPLSVPAPVRRALQGEAPLPPVIVPPALIWRFGKMEKERSTELRAAVHKSGGRLDDDGLQVSEFVEEGLNAPPGVVADDPDVVGLGSNCGLQEIALFDAALDPDDRQDDDHGAF